MKVLYVDNFRGFSKALIPLGNVNFFVGENSTGKTSLLTLIKVLFDTNFWFSQDHEFHQFDLGNFDEIVSNSGVSKNGFCVGVFDIRKSKDSDALEINFFLATFKNKQGVPAITNFSVRSSNSHFFHVRFAPKEIKYRPDKTFCFNSTDEKSITKILRHCLQEHNKNKEGYVLFPKPVRAAFADAPLGILLPIINLHIEKSESGSADKEKTDSKKKGSPSIPLHFADDPVWLAPIREKPRRTYDQYMSAFSPEGSHTPYILNSFLGDRRKKQKTRSLLVALEGFGQDSGLFKTIQVKRYGKHRTSPFEVDVILDQAPLRISNVGYGVAQVLPIIVECSVSKYDFFCIQQPEVHLHPRAQAALGSFFHSLAKEEDKTFFIETHSDYLIDRFRQKHSEHNVRSQVLFFERHNNANRVHVIDINPDGSYSDDQPKGFRDFFIKEELKMLSL